MKKYRSDCGNFRPAASCRDGGGIAVIVTIAMTRDLSFS
jgi:hypothetical protein